MSLYGINRRLEAQKRIKFEMKDVGTVEFGIKHVKDMKKSTVFYSWFPMEAVQCSLRSGETIDSKEIWVLRYTNRPVSPRTKYFDKFSYNYSPVTGVYNKDSNGNYIILQR